VLIEDPRAELRRTLESMQEARISLPFVECGTRTFEFLVKITADDMQEPDRSRLWWRIMVGHSELHYLGVTLKPCMDVPEGRLWPPRTLSALASERRINSDMEAAYGDATGTP
jgi:hypothetical protein